MLVVCLSNLTTDVCRNLSLLADRHDQPPIKGAIYLNAASFIRFNTTLLSHCVQSVNTIEGLN